jgi:hypothetical protein
MSLSLAPYGCPFGGLFLYVCMYVCRTDTVHNHSLHAAVVHVTVSASELHRLYCILPRAG